MKKLLLVILVCVMCLVGCSTGNTNIEFDNKQEVVIKIDGDITREMYYGSIYSDTETLNDKFKDEKSAETFIKKILDKNIDNEILLPKNKTAKTVLFNVYNEDNKLDAKIMIGVFESGNIVCVITSETRKGIDFIL